MMTVQELIQELNQCPPHMEVQIKNDYDFSEIKEVKANDLTHTECVVSIRTKSAR